MGPVSDSPEAPPRLIRFWQAQPVDLRLLSIDGKTPLGNCDMYFLEVGDDDSGHHAGLAKPDGLVHGAGTPEGGADPHSLRWG